MENFEFCRENGPRDVLKRALSCDKSGGQEGNLVNLNILLGRCVFYKVSNDILDHIQ